MGRNAERVQNSLVPPIQVVNGVDMAVSMALCTYAPMIGAGSSEMLTTPTTDTYKFQLGAVASIMATVTCHNHSDDTRKE